LRQNLFSFGHYTDGLHLVTIEYRKNKCKKVLFWKIAVG